jgi:filamentous hemagglutinin family protein
MEQIIHKSAHGTFAIYPWLLALMALSLSAPDVTLSASMEAATAQDPKPTILNWNSLSFMTNEAIHPLQPSVYTIALNRVIGMDQSLAMGQFSTDSRLVLVNPHAHRPGKPVVNTGEFLATTLQLGTNADPKAIVKGGTVHVSEHGYIALMSPGVSTEGIIVANVAPARTKTDDKVALDLMSDGLIHYAVDQKTLSEMTGVKDKVLAKVASRQGTKNTNGTQVLLSARSAGDILSAVVNTGGVSRAQRLVTRGEVVRLESDDTDITLSRPVVATNSKGDRLDSTSAGLARNGNGTANLIPGSNHAQISPTAQPEPTMPRKPLAKAAPDRSAHPLLGNSDHMKAKSTSRKPAQEAKSERKDKVGQNKRQSPSSTSATWRQPKWNFQADWGDGSSTNAGSY